MLFTNYDETVNVIWTGSVELIKLMEYCNMIQWLLLHDSNPHYCTGVYNVCIYTVVKP